MLQAETLITLLPENLVTLPKRNFRGSGVRPEKQVPQTWQEMIQSLATKIMELKGDSQGITVLQNAIRVQVKGLQFDFSEQAFDKYFPNGRLDDDIYEAPFAIFLASDPKRMVFGVRSQIASVQGKNFLWENPMLQHPSYKRAA